MLRYLLVGSISVLFVSACSTPVYKDEATQLSTSAQTISTSLPSEDYLKSASKAVVLDYDERRLLLGGALEYNLKCEPESYVALTDFLSHVQETDPAKQDAAFSKLAQIAPCALVDTISSAPPAEKKPENPKQISPKKAKAEADLASAERLARISNASAKLETLV